VALAQPHGEALQFVLGTEAGMITPIVRKVQALLAKSGRQDVEVEVVFPVTPSAISTPQQQTSSGARLELPTGARLHLPGLGLGLGLGLALGLGLGLPTAPVLEGGKAMPRDDASPLLGSAAASCLCVLAAPAHTPPLSPPPHPHALGHHPLALPAGLALLPGPAGGEGCSLEGGCASCPYMKMNTLAALQGVCEKAGTPAGEALLEVRRRRCPSARHPLPPLPLPPSIWQGTIGAYLTLVCCMLARACNMLRCRLLCLTPPSSDGAASTPLPPPSRTAVLPSSTPQVFKPRAYSELIAGKSIAQAGCEPILHMRHFQTSKAFSAALVADITSRNRHT
jgi:hypothetical protein